jgi:hypothetical protein
MKASLFQDVQRDPDAAAERLLHRAHNRDGLPEIVIGVILLTLAGLESMAMVSPPGSFGARASSWGLVMIVAPLCGGSTWLIKWARRRFLIEKAGYVELKPVSRNRLILAFGIAVVVAVAAAWAGSRGALPPSSWVLAGTGLIGGAFTAFAGRLPRYVAGGVIMALLGMILGFCRLSLEMGFTIMYGSIGMLSLVSGCVVLLHFMRTREDQ